MEEETPISDFLTNVPRGNYFPNKMKLGGLRPPNNIQNPIAFKRENACTYIRMFVCS